MPSSTERVLVIGLDAVEAALVDRLTAEGRMPALAALQSRGRRVDVTSHARLSGTVTWPSFVTGRQPEDHGIYNEWTWDPSAMTVRRPDLTDVVPFWSALAARGIIVGAIDVPFTPLVGLTDGFEIAEWGAHDRMTARHEYGPAAIGSMLHERERHPYGGHPPRSEHPGDVEAVRAIATTALAGIALRAALARDLLRAHRPDFSIIVFTELHDAGHHLWHTVEPGDAMYETLDLAPDADTPTLADLYTAVDRAIALLVDEVGSDASVLIVSLSGMRAGLGWPQLLQPMLERTGFATSKRSLRSLLTDRAALFSAVKRATPSWFKDLYHRRAGPRTQIKLARSTMVPSHDWSRTQAFEAMQDHYGYCRLNVEGRERDGIVPLAHYDTVRQAIVDAARDLHADDGRVLVADVVTPHVDGGPLALALPDLVLHWTRDAERQPVPTIGGREIPPPLALGRTGHHQATGFCIAAGSIAERLADPMETTGFAGTITDHFG